MRKNTSIDSLAAVTARQAQSDAAMMQRELKALRDGISAYSRAVKAPIPKGGSRTIKASRQSPSLLDDLADYAADSALGTLGVGGGYSSASQNAGNQLDALALGQRIR